MARLIIGEMQRHPPRSFARHLCFTVFMLGLSWSYAWARSVPGRVVRVRELSDVIRTAEIIAQVRITAGEGGERYLPVYRAEVEESFKGTKAGEILHLGGGDYSIGSVYLVFLRRSGTISERLRQAEFSRSFPPEAVYHDIETELFDQCRLIVTQSFGGVDVAASCPQEWLIFPRNLRQVTVDCSELEQPRTLVLLDQLYALIRERAASERRD